MNIGGLILGLGALGLGQWSKNKASAEQFQREKQLMGLQYSYNQQAMEHSADLNKEIWDYTNMENQVKHIKAAGLNPALMYSHGGGGGTLGSVGAQGVTNPGTQSIAMGLQAEQIMSQIRLTNAESMKAEAEAAKTAGVDTEHVKSEIEVNETIKALNKINTTVKEKEGINLDEQTKNLKQEWKKLEEEIDLLTTNAEIARETKQARIEQAANECWNTVYTGIETIGRIKLNEKQEEYINEQIAWYGYQCMTGRMSAEAAKSTAETAANRLKEEVKKWGKELSQEDERIIQEWVNTGLNGFGKVVEALSEFLPTKTLRTVIEKMTKAGKSFTKVTSTSETTKK